jgi:hypothetical protein
MKRKAKKIKYRGANKRKGFRTLTKPSTGLGTTLKHEPSISHASAPMRDIVLEKTGTALQRLVESAPTHTLVEALRTQTPFEALVHITSSNEAVSVMALQTEDPLRAAKARAAKHLLALLNAEGGPIGVEEASERLGITRAAVDKRRKTGTLIGISDRGRAVVYPNWQFTTHGVLPGFDEVLRSIGVQNEWMKMQFFLTYDPDLQARPLDALRKGDREGVLRAAQQYGRQGEDG